VPSITDGETHNISDWRAVGQHFGMTVTEAVAIVEPFFCFDLPPLAPFPLDRQWIYALNELVNQVNYNR
jgi:hypothetical protein